VGEVIMPRTKQEEVDSNFAFFQRELSLLLTSERGKFALIRDCKIEGFFDTALDAQITGSKLFDDGLFSIQQVTDDAVDLGYYSHAVHLGAD
jgi:hypothetical protein